jgi:ribonuclease HI
MIKQSNLSSFFIQKNSKILDTADTTADNDEYVLFFDGCCKGNPGPAGCGAVIYKKNVEIWCNSFYIGDKETNNISEYTGLIIGLKGAINLNIKHLIVKGDSELVIKQINGLYKIKSPNLIKLYNDVKQLQRQFNTISFIHVYRNENSRADKLSNIAMEIKRP